MLAILLCLIVIGVLVYIVNTRIPMDGTIKLIFNLVVLILVIVWLFHVFGIGLPMKL